MQSVKKGIVLPDLQFPNHNPKLLAAWEKYLASEPWDYLIYLGDFADMDAISHHAIAAGDWRSVEGKRLKSDYLEMSQILRRHRQIVGEKCETIFFLANHEEWAEKFVNKFPMLEGLIEIENNLPLAELGIKVIPYRGVFQIGELHFVHGDVNGGYTPVFHAKKMVETYTRHIVYGHHHTIQAATRVSPMGFNETHIANCLPAMCNIEPEWAKGRPNKWVNGFGVFYLNGNSHNVYPIAAINNQFITPEGRLYK